MALRIVAQHTDKEIEDYRIAQQHVRFICDHCGHRKMMRIADFEDGVAKCSICAKKLKP